MQGETHHCFLFLSISHQFPLEGRQHSESRLHHPDLSVLASAQEATARSEGDKHVKMHNRHSTVCGQACAGSVFQDTELIRHNDYVVKVF